jgi:hypothetical protein
MMTELASRMFLICAGVTGLLLLPDAVRYVARAIRPGVTRQR